MKKIIYLVVVLSIVACEIQAQRQSRPARPRLPLPPRREINIDSFPTNRAGAIIDHEKDKINRNFERAGLPPPFPNSQNQKDLDRLTGGLIIPNNPEETLRNLQRAGPSLTPNSQNQTGGLIIPNNLISPGINQRPSDSKPGTIPLR
jgi:hypothetical protein